jgi:hypothetical protein
MTDGHVGMCWPLTFQQWLDLQQICTTHHVVPIPVFDVKGNNIMPRLANNVLKGSTVFMQFRLHFSTCSLSRTFAACIPNHIVLLD